MPRSSEEVPGWMIPGIYFDYLRTGDASKVANVVYHNEMDIVSLTALYLKISKMMDEDLFSGNLPILDIYSIGQVFEVIRESAKAKNIYEHCLNSVLITREIKCEINHRLASIYKKETDWQKALPLWEYNAKLGDYDANLELAKYYEHIIREPMEALNWTVTAESALEKGVIPKYKKNSLLKELSVRKNRLENRINNVQTKNS